MSFLYSYKSDEETNLSIASFGGHIFTFLKNRTIQPGASKAKKSKTTDFTIAAGATYSPHSKKE
jgi:hypothetical protein